MSCEEEPTLDQVREEKRAVKKDLVHKVIRGEVEGVILEGIQEMEEDDLSSEEDEYSKIPKAEEVLIMKSVIHAFMLAKLNRLEHKPADTHRKLRAWGKRSQAKTPEEKALKRAMVEQVIHGEVEGTIIDEGVQEMEDQDVSDEEDEYEKIPKAEEVIIMKSVIHAFMMAKINKPRQPGFTNAKLRAWGRKKVKTPEEKAAKQELLNKVIHGEVEGTIIDEGVQEMEDQDVSDEEDEYEKIPRAEEVIIMKNIINQFMLMKVNRMEAKPDMNSKLRAWGKKK